MIKLDENAFIEISNSYGVDVTEDCIDFVKSIVNMAKLAYNQGKNGKPLEIGFPLTEVNISENQ